MLAKNNRLHKDKEIKSLIHKGQTFFLPEFVIKYQRNQTESKRFSFVISTKVDKKAVVRNRLKRQLREVARRLLPDINPGFDILIIAKKQALDLDFEKLSKQISFSLVKARVLKQVSTNTKINK